MKVALIEKEIVNHFKNAYEKMVRMGRKLQEDRSSKTNANPKMNILMSENIRQRKLNFFSGKNFFPDKKISLLCLLLNLLWSSIFCVLWSSGSNGFYRNSDSIKLRLTQHKSWMKLRADTGLFYRLLGYPTANLGPMSRG